MLTRLAILLGLALTVLGEDAVVKDEAASDGAAPDREGKFWWPKIYFVSLWNESCTTDSDYQGWCFKSSECTFRGGTADGSCAEDQGVCCDLNEGGDTTISTSGGAFTNKGYPDPHTRSGNTSAVLEPPSETVQIKLTFDEFNLTPPVDGDCNNDTFVFIGANSWIEVPVLCGYNTGQHLYIDVDASEGPYEMIVTTTDVEFDRTFKVTVEFYTLNDVERAPFRCQQFHPEKEGEITSFNYNADGDSIMLNNLMYSICFGYVSGFCDIGLTASRFDLGDINGNCMGDYLRVGYETICGDYVDYSFTANATGPVVLKVASDDDNSMQEEGFTASYMMMACS